MAIGNDQKGRVSKLMLTFMVTAFHKRKCRQSKRRVAAYSFFLTGTKDFYLWKIGVKPGTGGLGIEGGPFD